MLVHNLIQGSQEWREHRAKYKNASDTPVIMGLSKYKTRTQFLDERKSGIVADIDEATQKRFDDGHRYEALARPIAEKIIGASLYPVTGSEGEYGASFDGLDLDEEVDFEHKSLNDELRKVKSASDLGEEYLVQMEHQLMVCNGKKALFMASKWDANDELIEEIHVWYEPDADRRKRILDAWTQYDIDFENHVVTEVIEKPKAATIMALPSLAIQIKGEVTLSNLPEFAEAATAYIESIKTEFITDEDFANGEATITFCEKAEKNIELTKSAAIAQTASIDELMRTLDFIKGQLRDKRLIIEKLVKSEKENRKLEIVNEAKKAFTDHVDSHLPTKLKVTIPDFAIGTKNKKTLNSMKEAVNNILVNSKIEVDALARDIKRKEDWFNDIAKGYEFLFVDLQQIIYKANEDFQLLVNSRIKEHKDAEDKRKAEYEASIKAKAEADARAKVEAKQREKEKVAQINDETYSLDANNGAKQQEDESQSAQVAERLNSPTILPQQLEAEFGKHFPPTRTKPSANEMVEIIANYCHVDKATAHKWLCDTDFFEMIEKAA